MPFKSRAQRAYLYIHEPQVAKEFASKTPKGKKLPEHAKCAMVGKMGDVHGSMELVTLALVGKLGGLKGSGPAPVMNIAPLPDFNDIFYHPEDPEQQKREDEAAIFRRRSMADRNKMKFGLHGAPPPEPVLRYAPEDHVLVLRVKANERSFGDNANSIPPTPKVEGRETSGVRFLIRDPYVEQRSQGAPAPSQEEPEQEDEPEETETEEDEAKPKLIFREPKPKARKRPSMVD